MRTTAGLRLNRSMVGIPFSDRYPGRMEGSIEFDRSFYWLNYLLKIFVYYFMNRETKDVYCSYQGLTNNAIKSLSIQELFDLRHELMGHLNKLGELLKD